MSYIATVNPIVTRGFAFDPICQVEMIVTQGYGPFKNFLYKQIPSKAYKYSSKSSMKKKIKGYSYLIKGC